MDHLSYKGTHESATKVILETEKERLEQRKAELAIALGIVAEKLDAIDTQLLRTEFGRTKLTVELEWYRYDIDTYVSGYTPDNRYRAITYHVDAHDMLTAWLGLLATQPKPLAELPYHTKNSRELSVYLSSSSTSDATTAPVTVVQKVFSAARTGALTHIQQALAHVKDDNPYKNIPILINESALYDALVRERILQECRVRDPDFAISTV